MADITIINLWQPWSTCQRCGELTRSNKGWPYYEDFIIGDGEWWQEPGGFVPVCNCCYLELLAAEAVWPTRSGAAAGVAVAS